jgi:hypothetical protein
MVLEHGKDNIQAIGIVALNNVFQELSGIVEETQSELNPKELKSQLIK